MAIHPVTNRRLEQFVAAPSHAVALVGPSGVGKGSVARRLSAQLLGLSADLPSQHAYVRVIDSADGKAIGIEVVRELEHFLSLVVPGRAKIRRLVIIEQAQLMTIEAQNALLKTLEEPPSDTVIMLTTTTLQQLLPTIQSRLQSIDVLIPPRDLLRAVMPESSDFAARYSLCAGLPGILCALLTDEGHPLLGAVSRARTLLSQTSFERLASLDSLLKNKQLTIEVLTLLQHMAHLSLQTATGSAAERWRRVLTTSYEAAEALSGNAQPKLVLTKLCLSI
ncbi:MAG: hypothetical protein ABIV43_01040 [Candidatus Saccharimonadales bacterium]